jgi:hypothetical protein
MPVESELMLFEDKMEEDEWRVEYYDDDGGFSALRLIAAVVRLSERV